jgi:hypothetical protein
LILESVLTKEEPISAVESAADLSDPAFRDSGYCEIAASTVSSPYPVNNLPLSEKPPTLPQLPARRTRHEAISIDSALANEAFKSFRTQQKVQLERVSLFECSQRKALSAYHQCAMQRLEVQYKTDRDERVTKVRIDSC